MIPLLLLALPLAEIAGFVLVGSEIGALATIALVVATGILGALLVRIQGFGALTRIRATVEAGGSPGRELVHGVMIVVAGMLLMVPGFITDVAGLLLFLPPVREFAWRQIRHRIVVMEPRGGRRGPAGGRTIDLDTEDFSRKSDEPSPWRQIEDDDR